MKMENPQRSLNFWEPIYSPEQDNQYEEWKITDQDIATITGKKNSYIDLCSFKVLNTSRLVNFNFQCIDFIGELNDKYFVFTECIFDRCAFYKSTWKNIKFQKCSFDRTSFSLAKFEDCDFRDCSFSNISISGNEMEFINTYIEPYKFISAAYTNLDRDTLKEKNIDPKYQSYRLEGTKSSVARMLLQMRPIRNKIDDFMAAKHIARKCESFFLIKKGLYDLSSGGTIGSKLSGFISTPLFFIEYLFVLSIGWLSGWGLKIGRTLLIGFICTIGFSIYYKYKIFVTNTFAENYLKSLEYWFLFGYTKYDLKEIGFLDQLIIFSNSLLGLIWFGTILPVLLEKMGKDNE